MLPGRMEKEGVSSKNISTSQSVVREVVATGTAVVMVEGIQGNLAAQASILAMNLRAIACMPLRGIPTDGDSPQILGILYSTAPKQCIRCLVWTRKY